MVSPYEPGRCNKDACDQGFYPGKGAKHNLGQGQRGQAEVGELPTEAGVGVGEAGKLPRGSEDLRGLSKEGS